MKWEQHLLNQCYKIIPHGGEVHIQFTKRTTGNKKVVVPIIRAYPENQDICEEVFLID